ncbi:hypothetical protein PtrM4_012860 [Pyrenophora tritici-repentis]|uniref:Glucose-methanol-choline oxidoreductase N-terminal domain-containing protein n=1 Tax=Pyrenophora tritici-repentis TaxID=45151 RepID=A0A834S730_9PLEO|nr:hypothetical protein PtrM4_012860 [Pyrenophora tritici-repentis]
MYALIILSLFVFLALAITLPQKYDYIVVGGGTTGLVVANRLSEDPKRTVLVIENGALGNSTLSSIPGNSGGINLAAMYDMHSAPVPNLGNQSFLVTVGNVVGGGSYVNGMQFDRGADADYDAWGELGNGDWDWNGLKPYFMKSNHFDAPHEDTIKAFGMTYDTKAYGDGPLKVSILGHYWSPNSVNKDTGMRSTSRTTYYDGIVSRKNLKLLPNTTVRNNQLSGS